jgi:hypothetical protein
MNEDIKILREALKKYELYVEAPEGNPLSVPFVLYRESKEQYRQACDPDRIRRLLDDAERALDLELALRDASYGFKLASEAAGKGFNGEVLLHCGTHEARACKALGVEE